MNADISKVKARQILDSRGNPTVEVDVVLLGGAWARAAVASGASTGEHEALELRDGDESLFGGKSVLKAVRNVNEIIAPKICGMDALKQGEIDKFLIGLDGTKNKSRLGANAILGVSLAVAKAAACRKAVALYAHIADLFGGEARIMPIPMMNIINGGKHADNNIDLQEYMIIPLGAGNFSKAVQIGCEVFNSLKKILKSRGLSTAVGDEGGFAPDLKTNEEPIEVILEAIEEAGYEPGKSVSIALDPAASSFYSGKQYVLNDEDFPKRDSYQMIDFYKGLVEKYPIVSIEDGLAEDDWKGWKMLTETFAGNIQIVGDDLFVTNSERLKEGIDKGVANSILIKLNQIGTLTETLKTIRMAKDNGYTAVISHRSGETEDTTIAHLAVGTDAGQIKTGSMSRTDRLAKYNELLRIEEELGADALYGDAKWINKFI